MFKTKVVATMDTNIQDADKEYSAAVSLFENAKAKVEEANFLLENTDKDIDAQIEELLAKKQNIASQIERNAKFSEKITDFIG